MNITKSSKGSSRKAAEIVSIKVPKRLAANIKRVAAIFGYPKGDPGYTLEREAGWIFENLLKGEGDLIEYVINSSWSDEKTCRAVAKRAERIEKREGRVARVFYEEKRGWCMRFFDKGCDALALWDRCQEYGLTYEERYQTVAAA